MKLVKIWITLGILCLVLALIVYISEVLIESGHWCWITFFSPETGISLAGFVGAALLIVVAVEHWWKR